MGNLIDKYVLGARVAPAAIVAFTLFLAVSAWVPLTEWPIKLLGGSAFLAIGAFVLAQLTRDAGKSIEGALWASWGGPPTMRMLRHRDTTVAPGSKALIHQHLARLHIVDHMPDEVAEQESPDRADETYRTCSDWLRRKALELKAKTPFDVVHSENISYGFRRNLLGIKPYGIGIALAALALTTVAFFFSRHPFVELVLIAIVTAYLAFGVNAAAVKRAADDYSKRLLDAVQSLPLSSVGDLKAQQGKPRKPVTSTSRGAEKRNA